MLLNTHEKEKIIANQNLACSICFSKDFVDFKTYTVLDRPGMDFYILSSGHIVERNNEVEIAKAIEALERYFKSVSKDVRISILDNNILAKKILTECGYIANKEWDDNYYVFDADDVASRIPTHQGKFNLVRIDTKDSFFNFRKVTDLKYFKDGWLNNLARAFEDNKYPYIHYFVLDNKTAVGAGSLAVIDNKGFLMSATVNENYRRQGIYSMLMIERAKDCIKFKCNEMVLNTSKDNKETNTNAAKLGYVPLFMREFYVKG